MPRNGLGMPIVSGASNAPVTIIDDVLWEDFGGSGGEIAVNYQETRTNIVLHSQDTTDAEAWTKTNTAIDSTLYEAPDNSTTANAIKSNNTGERTYSLKQENLSVTAGKTYTLSVHLKKENLGFAQVRFADGSVQYRSHFNLTTGAMTNAAQVISNSIDAMDDGWFRCSITFQAQNTVSDGVAVVFAQSAAGDSTPNIAVSGVELLYVWGFQLEESIEATSYIVTTTEARTATTTLNDTSDVWDFDSADLMPEADPDSEGVWEVPANVVLNGDYEELGSELVTNGTFDADSNWTKGTGWTISGGSASCDGTQTSNSTLVTSSSISGIQNKPVKFSFELSNCTSGTISATVQGTGGQEFSGISENKTYTTHITSVDSTALITFTASSDFVGDIDNVSLKQVDPNDRWSLDSNWSIVNGKATSTGNGRMYQSISQFESASSIGTTVEVTFNIVERTSGGVVVNFYGGVSSEFNTVGTHSFITTTTNNLNLYFNNSGAGNLVGSIDNVTVKEYAITPKDV